MLNAMAFLAPRHGDHRNILVGGVIREPLTPAQSSWPLRVTTSDGTTVEPSLTPEGDGLAMTHGPVEKAHALTVSIGPETRVFSANVDPAESDLASVDEQVFLSGLDRDVRMINDPAAITGEPGVARSTELASFMLYLVVSLLFVEMWMAMRFGSQRAAPPLPADEKQ
jgi:hypothetical protein